MAKEGWENGKQLELQLRSSRFRRTVRNYFFQDPNKDPFSAIQGRDLLFMMEIVSKSDELL